MNNKVFAVTGLFDSADDIIRAARQVEKNGYKKYDINTPYPVHGMDKAMKLKSSPMGFYALAFGLTGTAIALSFMSWAMIKDYPMVIGGKPFFSLPAFIPITFELTVLLAAIGTVIALLTVFFKMPNNSHPLHDTNYMKSCTSDRFGVCIEASDPGFDETKIKSFLESIGAKDIETVFMDDSPTPKVFSRNFVYFLISGFVIVLAATYFSLNKLLIMEPFNWMVFQERVDAQSHSAFFKDGFSMRPPVEGTVPQGYMPYMFNEQPEEAGKNLANPLPFDEESINLGKRKFNTFCSPCHGNYAQGDSRLRGLFPQPPTLHSKKVREWSDGSIYHVLTAGQNIMPSYAKQLTRKERWAVIHYIRTLQRAFNPKEEDFNE